MLLLKDEMKIIRFDFECHFPIFVQIPDNMDNAGSIAFAWWCVESYISWKDEGVYTDAYILRELPAPFEYDKDICNPEDWFFIFDEMGKWIGPESKWMKSKTKCIGDGGSGSGCGPSTLPSGSTCPKCNGMILSEEDLKAADELVKQWEKEDNERKIK